MIILLALLTIRNTLSIQETQVMNSEMYIWKCCWINMEA